LPGPKPIPTKLKLLRGNPGHQRVNKAEPQPRPIAPDCPKFLNAKARRIWRDIVDDLELMGVLTTVDESTLAAYCSAYGEAQTLDAYLSRHGLTNVAPSGYEQQRPEVSIRNKAWDRVAKFGAELGIGAASRSRIEVKKHDDEAEDPTAKAIAIAAQRK
jgi:P27 family predicted phage terminase small subunit